MGFFGIGKEISDPVKAVGNALDSLFTSDEERANAQIILEKLRQKPQILQAEISKLEATSRSVWVAGWRPLCGYVCTIGLLYSAVIAPTIGWWCGVTGPQIDSSTLHDLLVGLLGLGTLRTAEKIKRVSK